MRVRDTVSQRLSDVGVGYVGYARANVSERCARVSVGAVGGARVSSSQGPHRPLRSDAVLVYINVINVLGCRASARSRGWRTNTRSPMRYQTFARIEYYYAIINHALAYSTVNIIEFQAVICNRSCV